VDKDGTPVTDQGVLDAIAAQAAAIEQAKSEDRELSKGEKRALTNAINKAKAAAAQPESVTGPGPIEAAGNGATTLAEVIQTHEDNRPEDIIADLGGVENPENGEDGTSGEEEGDAS
jgi:hypothetical protein